MRGQGGTLGLTKGTPDFAVVLLHVEDALEILDGLREKGHQI